MHDIHNITPQRWDVCDQTIVSHESNEAIATSIGYRPHHRTHQDHSIRTAEYRG